MDEINERIKKEKLINILFAIFAILFLSVFDGLAIFAVINDSSLLIIIYAVICVIFSIVMINMIIIKPVIDHFINKRINIFGHSTFANSYKLVAVNNSDRNNTFSRYSYSLRFNYLDEAGNERTGIEKILKVSQYFFTSYSVDKLPIKVWKKYAIIDYVELLKYQQDNKI